MCSGLLLNGATDLGFIIATACMPVMYGEALKLQHGNKSNSLVERIVLGRGVVSVVA